MTPLSHARILIVEDEYLIAMELKAALERVGAEIIGPVPSADAAFDVIDDHQGRLSAAVLDVNLGDGETSYPVADRLIDIDVPFVFATGEIRLKREGRYADRPFLEKPVLESELIRALAQLVERC